MTEGYIDGSCVKVGVKIMILNIGMAKVKMEAAYIVFNESFPRSGDLCTAY
jgi:hypothetical protein